jgi:DNA modification methylase
MKPAELVERAIRNSSKSEVIVLDQFSGSGTTLLACERTGRTCYMMALEAKYCNVTICGWKSITGKKAELLKG